MEFQVRIPGQTMDTIPNPTQDPKLHWAPKSDHGQPLKSQKRFQIQLEFQSDHGHHSKSKLRSQISRSDHGQPLQIPKKIPNSVGIPGHTMGNPSNPKNDPKFGWNSSQTMDTTPNPTWDPKFCWNCKWYHGQSLKSQKRSRIRLEFQVRPRKPLQSQKRSQIWVEFRSDHGHHSKFNLRSQIPLEFQMIPWTTPPIPKKIPNLAGIPGWNSRWHLWTAPPNPQKYPKFGWNSNLKLQPNSGLGGVVHGLIWNSNLEFQPDLGYFWGFGGVVHGVTWNSSPSKSQKKIPNLVESQT